MSYKFEHLEVWQIALEYIDTIYQLAAQLPRVEEYNLKSQIMRAATSIALNIAEGSTGQTNAEQARFIGMALRSLVETVACLRLIAHRGYVKDTSAWERTDLLSEKLSAKLHAFRNSIAPERPWVKEQEGRY
jgi:four helix bundle protein